MKTELNYLLLFNNKDRLMDDKLNLQHWHLSSNKWGKRINCRLVGYR